MFIVYWKYTFGTQNYYNTRWHQSCNMCQIVHVININLGKLLWEIQNFMKFLGFSITWQHFKEFYGFVTKLMNNHIILKGNLGNKFLILEQNYVKTEMVDVIQYRLFLIDSSRIQMRLDHSTVTLRSRARKLLKSIYPNTVTQNKLTAMHPEQKESDGLHTTTHNSHTSWYSGHSSIDFILLTIIKPCEHSVRPFNSKSRLWAKLWFERKKGWY